MGTVLSTSLVFAEDFKTVSGKEYKNATITRVEGDGIVIKSKTGISKIYFVELPKDVQERFHYSQASPVPAPHERAPSELEAKQDNPDQSHGAGKVVVVGKYSGRTQPNQSGRVVVVGHGVGSAKIIIAGIVILVVVLAVVRSRL